MKLTKEFIDFVLKRDRFACQQCGREAHKIYKIVNELWCNSQHNYLTLCVECAKKRTK